MFTSKSSLPKVEDIQKRALRFVLDNYTSDYHELLNKADVPGVKIMALRYLAIEVYKCVNGLIPKYLNDLFTIKKCKYDLRDDSLINRSKVSTTNHGLKSFKDYGAKIWNILPKSCKGIILKFLSICLNLISYVSHPYCDYRYGLIACGWDMITYSCHLYFMTIWIIYVLFHALFVFYIALSLGQ